MTDLKPQHSPTDAPDPEAPVASPVAADGGNTEQSGDDGYVATGNGLTYDQRADAAAEAVRQVALHLGLAKE